MFKRRENIVYVIVTLGTIILTFLERNQVNFIYGLMQLLIYCILFCTIIYNVYRLIRNKKRLTIRERLQPLVWGFILTGFFFLLSYLVDTDGGKKRLLVGGVDHDMNFIHFQLFADNTFKLLNSGPFGGSIYRGNYHLVYDTLLLNNNRLRHLYPDLQLVRREHNGKMFFEPTDTTKLMYTLFVYDNNFKTGKREP